MSKKTILTLVAAATLLFGQAAKAQNLQIFYDFGKDRQYITTTFEMFKADKFGDTFWFIDHNFNPFNPNAASYRADDNGNRLASANSTYFEIERGINFWQESALKDLSGHIEYDGSSWGAGIFCFGAKYFLHSKDFRNMLTLYLMYDLHVGVGKATVPVKFSAVWSMGDLFGLKGLTFKGFMDVWGNDSVFADGSDAKVSVLTEPQLWMNLGRLFDNHLDLGCEIELSYNFAGNKGFMCNPCAGLRWTF